MTEILTIAVFVFTYMTIALQKIPIVKIDRPSGVLTGSTLLIIVGSISLSEAYTFIDWDVITFLMGMMIITSYLEYSGFFPLAAMHIVKMAKTGKQLLLLVILGTALLSALFVNDTICLLFTPVLLAATKELRINPVPFLLAVAFSSNVGSAFTVTGNPQNMYIGIVSGIPFLTFMLYTAIPVVLSLAVVYFVLCIMYKKDLGALTAEISEDAVLIDRALIIKSLLALTLVLTLFICHVSYPFAALVGATAIILCGRVTPRIPLSAVDWQLLIFFAGLFVVMGAIEKTAFMDSFMRQAVTFMEASNLSSIAVIGVITLVLSNLVSNVPAVMMVYPAIEQLPEQYAAYLALVSTFAGNLTIIGSVANLIVIERARMSGINISFMTYFKAGIIVTLASTLIAAVYVLMII